ncbi:MAG TPA: M3 family metallopeptidase [Pseudobdellovibrionaceae bacterium]|nr:M3 family metallopeptidase [Pseudobdellovibrionaceae bacterium]
MTELNLHNSTNPLLTEFKTFENATPFDLIKLEHFLPAIEQAITLAKNNLEKIATNTEPPSFENSLVAIETCSELLNRAAGIFSNLKSAHGNDEIHALAQKIYPRLSEFSSDLLMDARLFEKVKSVYLDVKSGKIKNLTGEQQKLLEDTYKNFIRNGAELTPSQKEVLKNIDQELSKLSPQFSQNQLKSMNAFELYIEDSKSVEGIPESSIEAAAQLAKEKGKSSGWIFTLQGPSFIPFMTYGKDRQLREKMWKAYGAISYRDEYDNQDIILKLVNLKDQRAKILGYENHATYVLEERMAEKPEQVKKFLDQLFVHSKPAAQKDLIQVKELALQLDQISDLKPWDFSYYSEKLKEKLFSFNDEELRPYFKLENVIQGVFLHAEKLYNLEFKKNSKLPVYHPDVEVYEAYDKPTQKFMGLFYTDFFPRESKQSGAWATTFRNQGLEFGKIQRPHVSIVCNFTKPTATKPSLLNYDEVKTLFHEFGHALHMLLSDATYSTLAGANVYWDFVELPSQIFENWVDEKESLDLFATHYQTKAPMPQEYIKKIKDSTKFQVGWMSLRQLAFSYLDLAWHSADPKTIQDVTSFELKSTSETQIFPPVEGVNRSCSFGHIFAGGYSAGYYSYKWAEVLDADAFEYFKEYGIFNQEVSLRFKEHILSRGGTEHPMELYKKFRGREPDPKALLRREGLV